MRSFKFTILLTVLITTFGSSIGEANCSYHAAGVFPYALDGHGTVKFLMGLSSVHADHASDFGGLRDTVDSCNPQLTAVREGCEELMFIFDTDSDFKKLLELHSRHGKRFDLFKAGNASCNQLFNAVCTAEFSMSENYIMYFIRIPYQENLPELFQHRKTFYEHLLPHCWNETKRLVWVDRDEVFNAIDNRSFRGPVAIKDFSLYEPFVQSLITARSQGIIATLKSR